MNIDVNKIEKKSQFKPERSITIILAVRDGVAKPNVI